jgi:hypothetical protein
VPSLQLERFFQLRANGVFVDDAAEQAGLGIAEARLWEREIAAGEIILPEPSTKETTMPVGKTNEEEELETPQPHIAADIGKIAELIKKDGPMDKLLEKLATARGALAQKYQHIENDLHGNRKAVKLVITLLNGTTDAAYDFMRTFMRLAAVFDLLPADDLVDLAEKVDQAKPKDEDSGVSTADMAPKSAEVVDHPSRENAIDRHKKALAGGEKPPAPDGPEGDTDFIEAADAVAAEIEQQRSEDAQAFEQTSPAA